MKGLPFKASAEDVIKFFQGFTLSGDAVYLRRHPDGRPNGEAFIVFETPDEARRATQKDRETFGDKFGDRYVRVYPTLESDVSDMQTAVLQQSMAHQQGNSHSHGHADSVVKIKSLPFDATQLDIIQFFETFRLKPNGVQLVVRSDNKPTGEAFVDFETPEEAARAIREKDHKVFSEKFGDRYVRLIQVSRKEMQATLALRFGGEGILKMKGIPFKATAADVRKFFAGYRIKPDGISFIMHADGRPTGMAFIEFETPQEAVRAMEKDRAKFGPEYGDRFCMLQLVGRHEMDKVTLQKESESNANKLLVGAQNGINVLQAAQAAAIAQATQAALQNPALQPMLLGGAPWLNQALQFGLVNPSTAAALGQLQGNNQGQMLDAASLAQYGAAANGQGGPNNGYGAAALNLLQQQAPMQNGNNEGNNWGQGVDNSLLFYQNQGQQGDWQRDARLGLAGLTNGVPHSSAAPASLAPLPGADQLGLLANKQAPAPPLGKVPGVMPYANGRAGLGNPNPLGMALPVSHLDNSSLNGIY